MLARLVVAIVVLGAVAVPVLELLAADNNRKNSRQRRLRSIFTKLARKKLELQGQLRSENMRPLVGALVYVDASRCSLALPLNANKMRDACDDVRIVTPTDQRGRYLVKLRVSRSHKYLHVRFHIAAQGERAVVMPLASVDHMLGKMPAGSYYRLDRDAQLALLRAPRDLIYASRRIALHTLQLRTAWLQENRHLIARTLARALTNGDTHKEHEVVSVSSCGQDTLHRNEPHLEQQPTQLVDFRFLLPAAGINAQHVADDNDCHASIKPLDSIVL